MMGLPVPIPKRVQNHTETRRLALSSYRQLAPKKRLQPTLLINYMSCHPKLARQVPHPNGRGSIGGPEGI